MFSQQNSCTYEKATPDFVVYTFYLRSLMRKI